MPSYVSRSMIVLATTGYVLMARMSMLHAQVSEGETEIVNVRETDEHLGPLVFTLVGLGAASLLATFVFWFLTRPSRTAEGSS